MVTYVGSHSHVPAGDGLVEAHLVSTEPELGSIGQPTGNVWGGTALHCVPDIEREGGEVQRSEGGVSFREPATGRRSPQAVLSRQFSGSCVASSIFGSLHRYMKRSEGALRVCVSGH